MFHVCIAQICFFFVAVAVAYLALFVVFVFRHSLFSFIFYVFILSACVGQYPVRIQMKCCPLCLASIAFVAV